MLTSYGMDIKSRFCYCDNERLLQIHIPKFLIAIKLPPRGEKCSAYKDLYILDDFYVHRYQWDYIYSHFYCSYECTITHIEQYFIFTTS